MSSMTTLKASENLKYKLLFMHRLYPAKPEIWGGVVKVNIYEVDTKIALKVDTFLLGL